MMFYANVKISRFRRYLTFSSILHDLTFFNDLKYCYDNDNHAIELNADNAFNYWFLPGY